jgi:hypothetical protein
MKRQPGGERGRTGRRIVADSVDGLHAGQSTSAAHVRNTANLLCTGPHKLREVAPLGKVSTGVALAIVARRELVEFTAVPHVAGSLSTSAVYAKRAALGTDPHGEVLAVAATTRSPSRELASGTKRT